MKRETIQEWFCPTCGKLGQPLFVDNKEGYMCVVCRKWIKEPRKPPYYQDRFSERKRKRKAYARRDLAMTA